MVRYANRLFITCRFPLACCLRTTTSSAGFQDDDDGVTIADLIVKPSLVLHPTLSDAEAKLRAQKTSLFLQNLLLLSDNTRNDGGGCGKASHRLLEEACDMIAAAERLGTLRPKHWNELFANIVRDGPPDISTLEARVDRVAALLEVAVNTRGELRSSALGVDDEGSSATHFSAEPSVTEDVANRFLAAVVKPLLRHIRLEEEQRAIAATAASGEPPTSGAGKKPQNISADTQLQQAQEEQRKQRVPVEQVPLVTRVWPICGFMERHGFVVSNRATLHALKSIVHIEVGPERVAHDHPAALRGQSSIQSFGAHRQDFIQRQEAELDEREQQEELMRLHKPSARESKRSDPPPRPEELPTSSHPRNRYE